MAVRLQAQTKVTCSEETAMSYAFELHFDQATEAMIRPVWRMMARQGFETSRNGIAPHVTLAIASRFEEGLGAALRQFAAAHPPFAVEFRGIDAFPSGVRYFAVTESDELRAAHRDFHARFPSLPPALNSHYYGPSQWVPHCTIATGAPMNCGPVSIERDRPSGHFARLRVVEYPTLKLHFDCPLGGGKGLS
jgi:2'-5' RNA ligase